MIKKLSVAAALSLLCLVANATQAWQAFSTVVPATTGASYNLSLSFIPTSSYTTYSVQVVDTLEMNSTWTITSSIQIKDSSGNNVCSTPTSTGVTFQLGTSHITSYVWQQSCNAGTLTNGNIYSISVVGAAWSAASGVPKPPQLMVYLNAN